MYSDTQTHISFTAIFLGKPGCSL